ncbi:2,3-bisphosphoglycerate-independent phosphoglycerate mutase [Streptomyces sp. SKN60]|uniref:2,3-bisphosphoglycerate-independent phosphoglycerate mutase n=1 Tax=Streptomyces TaxID=1883 RepID=UPI002247B028|nr:2,3-bisphosphoglycerate-independent phosphoglycerate mutase [Streptomyces sp. SKN60]MCX2181325.1 2,3-bisphosphoglycerate-independent phosphoglycerate mutase [Streptomyces sp. SKN60]
MSAGTPGILLVLDGWGHAAAGEANALTAAATPYLDGLLATCPTVLADASGTAVGLLPGTVGNSEIGHMVIGAGRPIPYDSVLVQEEISSGRMRSNEALTEVLKGLAASGGALHLIGLCSDGMIHANVQHLQELLRIAAQFAVPRVRVHAITDGRDVADHTAAAYLGLVDTFFAEAGIGEVATVVGRGYALDKSGNLELTEKVSLAIVDGKGEAISEPQEALELTQRGDEWVPPCVVTSADGRPLGAVQDGDAILFTNFRSDRIQQLADDLHTWLAGRRVTFLSLAQYDTKASIPALVHRSDAGGGLATVLGAQGVRSVRIAEAEKFEHVTYYLNGRDSNVVPVEEHVRITGDRAPDYTVRPAMNIDRVTEAVISAARRDDVPLVVANLANIDVVGHTGHFDATRQAAEHTDRAVEAICGAAQATGRWVLLVGDHGNAEKMLTDATDGDGWPYGGHTTNPVPAVLVPAAGQKAATPAGPATLADIAPSVLALLGLAPEPRMTGRPLW